MKTKNTICLMLMILSSITISAQNNELNRRQLALDYVEQFRTAIQTDNREFIDAIIENPIIYNDKKMISKSDLLSLYGKFRACRFDEIEITKDSTNNDVFKVFLKYELSNDSNMLNGCVIRPIPVHFPRGLQGPSKA